MVDMLELFPKSFAVESGKNRDSGIQDLLAHFLQEDRTSNAWKDVGRIRIKSLNPGELHFDLKQVEKTCGKL